MKEVKARRSNGSVAVESTRCYPKGVFLFVDRHGSAGEAYKFVPLQLTPSEARRVAAALLKEANR